MLRRIVSAIAIESGETSRFLRSSTSCRCRRTLVGTVVVLGVAIGLFNSRSAAAAISVVDNAITPISSGGNPTTFSIAPFTVSSAANVLIVEVGTRGVQGSADTITFGNQTLTLAAQLPSTNTAFRDSAIYYLFNPTPGTATLSGTFTPTGISDYVLSALTLGGVNTAIAPITTSADGTASASATATLTAAQAANVVAGSFAVMEQTLNGGTGPFTYSATAGGNASGTGAQMWQGTSGTNILAAGGNVSNLAAATDSFTGSATTNTNTKNPLVVAVFAPVNSVGVIWVGGTSSDWGVGGNWQGGAAPNGSGAQATFGNASSNPTVSLLNSGETVGAIVFNPSVGTTIGGANTLTFANGSSVATITVNGGTHALNAPVALSNNLTISTVAGSQLTLGGNIGQNSSGRSLITNGAGTLILTGSNSFSGGVTIGGGTLRASNGSLGSGNVSFTGGVLQYASGNTQDISAIIKNSTSAINLDVNGNSVAFGANLDATNTGGLALSSSTAGGGLILGVANTFSGPTTISSGMLQLNNVNNLQNSTVTVGNNNGLSFGPGIGTFIIGGLAGAGNLALSDTGNSAITLNVGGNNASTAYSGNVNGAGGLAKTGSGTLTLTGAGNYSGGTTVSSGVVVANSPGSLGTGAVTIAGGATLRPIANPLPLIAGFGGTNMDITGTGTGWTVNSTTITANPINNNVLTLTDNNGTEARTAFFNTPQPIAGASGGFLASFTYLAGGNRAADGVVFMLQNDARGVSAIGGNGGGFGYTTENAGVAIQPSVAVALNIYGGHVIGTNLLVNGNPNGDVYLPSAPVNPGSGNPIAVTIAYNASTNTVTETLTDTVANNTFTTQYANENLASILGSNTALVGFGGATGGAVATQTISNFSYGVDNTYSNNIVLPGDATATVDVGPTVATPTVAMGNLIINGGAGSTLNVTAMPCGLDSPETNEAFTVTPEVVYSPIVPLPALMTNRFVPDTAIPDAVCRPETNKALTVAPEVVYSPTVESPVVTNRFPPDITTPLGSLSPDISVALSVAPDVSYAPTALLFTTKFCPAVADIAQNAVLAASSVTTIVSVRRLN